VLFRGGLSELSIDAVRAKKNVEDAEQEEDAKLSKQFRAEEGYMSKAF